MSSNRYVPPQVRNNEEARAPFYVPFEDNKNDTTASCGEQVTPQRGSLRNYFNNGPNSGFDSRDRYNDSRAAAGVHSTQSYFQSRDSSSGSGNSRWEGLKTQPSYHSNYSRRSPIRVNELGFHGNMNPSRITEKNLFDYGERVTEGINFDNYDDIPVEVSGDAVPTPITDFTKENIPQSLLQNIIRCNYKRPTPVQKYGLAIGSAGRDLMACAQTGSGKTAGYLFPIIGRMIKTGPRVLKEAPAMNEKYYPTCLILSPTRELAVQIHVEAQRFSYCTGVGVSVVYGGTQMRETLSELRHGCDILVGTPGRLLDLIERDYLGLEGITTLVLDEADRMLDMGFEPQIRAIVEENRMPLDRQTMMFSATFPSEIQRLAGDFLNNYIFLAVGRVGGAAKDIEQRVMYVEEADKDSFLLHELEGCGDGRVLIFVETKRKADLLQQYLYKERFYVASIHGDRSQVDREEALAAFKTNRVQILVATDVAARGLDIPDVSLVVNYDTPQNIDDYVHRIGRTGRAGNTGVAISFINDNNRTIARDLYDQLEESEQKIPAFLEDLCSARGGSRGGRGGRGFGGRDIRRGGKSSQSKFMGRPMGSGEVRSEPRGDSRSDLRGKGTFRRGGFGGDSWN